MTGWRDRAACRGVDINVFFPDAAESHAAADRYCRACPVRSECLNAALHADEHGIWGGMSHRQRTLFARDPRQRQLTMREYDCFCEECGGRFVSRYMHAKTCSDTCRQTAYRRRKAAS